MKPVILLDIDGVLNPSVCPGSGGDRPVLLLSNEKRALVRRLARSGRITWVSTWPADVVAGLEAQLGLETEPLRVTMVFRPADADSPTPKLTSVTRWLYRMSATEESDWDSVVWIDDALGTDAKKWATEHDQPVHLEQPDPDNGLTEEHVVRIEAFVAGG
jgi:HAD domain in Swiss Army Knife RNA repair proteins